MLPSDKCLYPSKNVRLVLLASLTFFLAIHRSISYRNEYSDVFNHQEPNFPLNGVVQGPLTLARKQYHF